MARRSTALLRVNGPPLRLLWVATADARGHLMRAQLLWHELTRAGAQVEMWTTSASGVEFLDSCGVPARLLSPHYRVEFDSRQNMRALATDWRTAHYLLNPGRLKKDLATLAQRAQGTDLVINDSFHPALLGAPVLERGRRMRVVHVYAHQLRSALENHYVNRLPPRAARLFGSSMARLIARAHGRIQHSVAFLGADQVDGVWRLPPVMARPTLTRAAVRERMGVGPQAKVAAVYLNPHFTAPEVAQGLEDACAQAGLQLYGVAEGYARRRGWTATDPLFSSVVAAADVYLSSPGMGALNQARALGVPFLALLSRQPEQLGNVALLPLTGAPTATVWVGRPQLTQNLVAGLKALLDKPAAVAPRPWLELESAYQSWVSTLHFLAGKVAPRGPP